MFKMTRHEGSQNSVQQPFRLQTLRRNLLDLDASLRPHNPWQSQQHHKVCSCARLEASYEMGPLFHIIPYNSYDWKFSESHRPHRLGFSDFGGRTKSELAWCAVRRSLRLQATAEEDLQGTARRGGRKPEGFQWRRGILWRHIKRGAMFMIFYDVESIYYFVLCAIASCDRL